MRNRTITINGFSKSYAMTGWRLGYIAAPKELTGQMLKIHQYNVTCAATMGQFAAIKAMKNGDKDIADMREEYDRRRMFILKSLEKWDLSVLNPKVPFMYFPQ